ncbi:MAG TPA: NADP-dependent isocitrate dehydrogenase, partial [Solibacterales bacterium]|nr:NADP-dependent isocitrate dehydrogenase [Bryobacterales bacterium]
EFGDKLKPITHAGLTLQMMSNRGTAIWPNYMSETFVTDNYRCRFLKAGGASTTQEEVLALLQKVAAAGHDIVKVETLRTFDGAAGYTLAQGQ